MFKALKGVCLTYHPIFEPKFPKDELWKVNGSRLIDVEITCMFSPSDSCDLWLHKLEVGYQSR